MTEEFGGISIILEENIGKNCILFTDNNFRYNCKIMRVFGEWVEFLDLLKGYTKIMRISSIKEVELQ